MVWYPMIEFMESDNTVTLNPFRNSPVVDSTLLKSKQSLNIGFDTIHTKAALVKQLIGSRFVVAKAASKDETLANF